MIISADIVNAKTRFSWKFLRILETLARLKYFSRLWLCGTKARVFKNSHSKYENPARSNRVELPESARHGLGRYVVCEINKTVRGTCHNYQDTLSASSMLVLVREHRRTVFRTELSFLFYKILDQLVDRLEISQLTIGCCDTR